MRRLFLSSLLGLGLAVTPGIGPSVGASPKVEVEAWASFDIDDDSEFRVMAPSPPIQISSGPEKFLWSCGTPDAVCVCGYAPVGDAKDRIRWRQTLDRFCQDTLRLMNVKVATRKNFDLGPHTGIEIVGRTPEMEGHGWRPVHLRFVTGKGCARIYLLSAVGKIDGRRFLDGLRVRQPSETQ